MEFFMTRNTNWNNIKVMFRFITFIMMIVLCLSKTIVASQRFGMGQFFVSNSVIHGLSCLVIFRMKSTKAFLGNSAFYAILIAIMGGLSIFALSVFLLANFTIMSMSTFSASVYVKFRYWFGIFANIASFRYDCFRHYFLLYRKFCLEPVAAHTAVGSFYCKALRFQVNGKMK